MDIILAYACRNSADPTAWWMSGTADSLYFFVLFRSTVHGDIRLQKMAGDLLDSIISKQCIYHHSHRSHFFSSIAPRIVESAIAVNLCFAVSAIACHTCYCALNASLLLLTSLLLLIDDYGTNAFAGAPVAHTLLRAGRQPCRTT